ncbi:adhesion G protein-coupled receptor B2-like isoform X3 [Scleropages formosus]|uniref:adhesion G protein-coupled receptor B2-like isoform X3 n=1 Tax=Scleropages formosus TaxID=113540 RepID=UPI0010FA89CD|nr:adhesion G protein-coupled receptor B2-like isoform X3 [Scleropages formosus]
MNTGQLRVYLLWSFITLTPALSPPCVSLLAGVLYGSFSLRDIFPTLSLGCSWTLENPDPTKFSLYMRFLWSAPSCLAVSPTLLALDHYLSNDTCTSVEQRPLEARELCHPTEPHSLLQFDKNFVQLCLAAEPVLEMESVVEDVLDSPVVEVLMISNENSSLFTCAVLCRWLEECVSSHRGSPSCRVAQTDCICPDTAPPIPVIEDSHSSSLSYSSNTLFSLPDKCCVTQLDSQNGGKTGLEDEQKVKMQRARSVGSPGPFQAQTGGPPAEAWSLWGGCSTTCGPGWQVRTRSCVPVTYSTVCSGPLRESRPCYNNITCPVHGLWEEWAPWSLCSVTCGKGSRIRTRSCVAPQHGGKACGGPEEQSKACNIAACPASGTWGPWSAWSECSQTCGSGSQQRVRECQGDPCHDSRDETRSCREKECPADHKVCQDDFLNSISWRKTAVGEMVFTKCPSDTTGSASRRCLLDAHGLASWAPPSFARCISLEYRYLYLLVREHLAKGQRTLAAEGMSQVVRSLHQLLSRRSYYSGDLLFSVEILHNVTDTFRRAAYVPAAEDTQKFFQAVSFMLDTENQEMWEDIYQVSMASEQLLQIVEDFIHLLGEAQRVFHTSLVVTDNLMVTIQREPVSAVSSDIRFPMKGRRGMKGWARTSQDKLFIPKELFTLASAESEDSSSFVIGVVLYRTLGFILPAPESPLMINSKVLTVTVRPPPKPMARLVTLDLYPLLNGTLEPSCAVWDYGNREAGPENWDTESCQTLPSTTVQTKCLCSKLSTFAVLTQQPNNKEMKPSTFPPVPVLVGTVVSCAALLILKIIYFIFWSYIRSERSIILVNFCLSILLSNALILVGQSHSLSKGLCIITAALLHFFSLSSFCWVLTEAWHSYLDVVGKMKTQVLRKRFLCLGWGLPALVVAVSLGFTRTRGYGTSAYCWLSLQGGLLYAFVGPAALIVLVNLLIGIVIFNKLMARDSISDAHTKQRAGVSLWSSCVVLPMLALTWMSAVLAITDGRSALFQVLFGVFDGIQGVVILMVHGVLRREVQDAVRGRPTVCSNSEHSEGSCKNGQTQVDFEKGLDLTSHTVIFKELDTCNLATITRTLSRISLDEREQMKAPATDGGVRSNRLPRNALPPNLVQLPPLGSLSELRVQRPKEAMEQHRQQEAPVYVPTDSVLHWARPPEPQVSLGDSSDGDYMNLPPQTLRDEGQRTIEGEDEPPRVPPRLGGLEAYHSLLSLDHMSLTLSKSCGIQKNLPDHLQPRNTIRGHTHRTLPRRLGSSSSSHSAGSLEVMHNRKQQHDLYHWLNHTKFHSIDRYQQNLASSAVRRENRLSISSAGGERDSSSGKSTPDDHRSWDGFRTMTLDPSPSPEKQENSLELQNQHCDTHTAHTPDTSEEDYQTEV